MHQKNENPNDRGCTRIPKSVRIEIKKLEYPLSDLPKNKGVTRNIAERGICFIAPTEYKTGDILGLSMMLHGWHRHRKGLTAILSDELSETDVLTVVAEVIWSRESSIISGYDIGVKFINIYEDDMVALERYFSRISP